jgi:hypothetical protein
MIRRTFVVLAGAALAAPLAAGAQTLTLGDAIGRLFTSHAYQPSWFAAGAGFPPPATLQSVVAGFATTLGPYQSIAPNGTRFTITFAHGTMQAEGALDASGAFTSLLFSRMQSKAAADRLAALFTAESIPAAWFSDRFLQALSLERIRSAIAAIKAQNGAFTSITPRQDGSYDLAFAKGHVSGVIDIGPGDVIEDFDLLPPSQS